MATYFVSRHKGAIAWLNQQRIAAQMVSHLDATMIEAGDEVLGTLPVQEVAVIVARGARYFHLEMTVPEAERGRELTVADMVRFGARLVEYRVVRVDNGKIQ